MPSSLTGPSTFTTMPLCRAAEVFGVSSMNMLAVVSSKRTPLTIVLPFVMTPVDTVGVGVLVAPVPPVPPPQLATTNAANAAESTNRRVFMIAGPLASATPSLSPFGEFRSVRSFDDRRELGERRVDLDQLACCLLWTHRAR